MAEAETTSGTLKVFLGMCPGVGKTYAMLEAARELQARGQSVVAGVVETHGRRETAALLDGLEILPPAKIFHRATVLAEFDLDAMLARKPKVALIDELAHSNAPGSRHPKRWQDIVELLENGIDVLTTVNIQHLESRSDIVGAITGAPVRETVPDSFLDRANEIELIDLTPRDLRARLEEGKVYLGERAIAAASNFFKPGNLTALRQLALRYAAERVGADLHGYQAQLRDRRSWRTSDKLLVAVGPSPFSPSLIRRTRAMAGALNAPWCAIAVSTDETLSPADQENISLHLSLARQLGADAATVESTSLVDGLLAAARERGVTQIVIGKSPRHGWRDRFIRPPALRLLQQSGHIDVIAIEPGKPAEGVAKQNATPGRPSLLSGICADIARAAGITAILTALAVACSRWLDADNVALLMLCGVIAGAVFLRTTGTFVLALLIGLAWNFFLTEPRYTFRIESASDVTLFAALTVAALAMGHLSSRLHRRERSLTRQQRHYARLLEIDTILTSAHDTEETVERSISAVTSLFGFPCSIRLRDDASHQLLASHRASTLATNEKDQAVANWAFENKQAAGKGTGTLAESAALHLPLQGRAFAMGVLSVDPGGRSLPLAERDQLATIAAQLGLALERNHLLRAVHHAEFLERSEQLRRSLLDHVSHELRTPVAVISSSIDALESGTAAEELLPDMRSARRRLLHVVDQLVESARVETGAVRPRAEWCDLQDLLDIARERAADALAGHPLETEIAKDTPPLVWIDGELLLAALGNLLANSGHHTPNGTQVSLHASIDGNSELEIRVRDKGPGLQDPVRVFDRFARGGTGHPGGLGLGLSIVRGLARGLGGTAEARNHEGGGAEFILRLPVKTAMEIPEPS